METALLTLAIDCALRRIELGLSDGHKTFGELSCDAGTRQAELLPMSVSNFLSLFGYTVKDVGLIAVTQGPGYFTGIRVGISYAASLAESVGALVVAVPTLLAMALPLLGMFKSAGVPMTVAPLIPAGRDSLYAAVYGYKDDKITASLEPSHIKTSDFMDVIAAFDADHQPILTGVTLPVEPASHDYAMITPPPLMSSGILEAARTLAPIDPAEIRAVYLREPG
ncbi:MAG: tRNA (adenosine(37)-N6)-threonylcarbamoyltransferase complex dimerization subunit type 1 TsaB [Synergistaceae bacterium]|jgi:tRNA threonylcarbamoyladenosine biosynthesis protein TsaB|nr:tRNA (adenosine(37)-N6)-threonylcarbamoyltransferase complex dimerization subunit type 1 TsaB [Synergistaceae bacterium]